MVAFSDAIECQYLVCQTPTKKIEHLTLGY